MEKQIFIQITNDFIQSFASLTVSEQKRVFKMAKFKVPPSLSSDYKEYQNYCQAFLNALPEKLKQVFVSESSKDLYKNPSQSKDSSQVIAQATFQAQSPANAKAQDQILSPKVKSLGVKFDDKRFIVSFIKSFPFKFQKVIIDNFVATNFINLVEKNAFYLPFSLRNFLNSSNLKYKIKNPSSASFTLEIQNPITGEKKDFSFLIANATSFQEELKNLDQFLSQNQNLDQNLDTAIQMVEHILNLQVQGAKRATQRNRFFIDQNLYQIDFNKNLYLLKQLDSITKNPINQISFSNINFLNESLYKLQESSTKTQPSLDSSLEFQPNNLEYNIQKQEPINQNLNLDLEGQSLSSLKSDSMLLNPSKISSHETLQRQTVFQPNQNPADSTLTSNIAGQKDSIGQSGLNLVSGLVPGLRRMNFNPGQGFNQNPSSNPSSLMKFYQKNKRAIPPLIGSISALAYVIISL